MSPGRTPATWEEAGPGGGGRWTVLRFWGALPQSRRHPWSEDGPSESPQSRTGGGAFVRLCRLVTDEGRLLRKGERGKLSGCVSGSSRRSWERAEGARPPGLLGSRRGPACTLTMSRIVPVSHPLSPSFVLLVTACPVPETGVGRGNGIEWHQQVKKCDTRRVFTTWEPLKF